MPTQVRSSVVLLELGDQIVLHRRPETVRLCPGMLQFLGGHVEPGEHPKETARRELGEETTLDTSVLQLRPLWDGNYRGVDRDGNPINNQVDLFRARIDELPTLLDPGALVCIPRTQEGVEAHAEQLAPFAYNALQCFLGVKQWD